MLDIILNEGTFYLVAILFGVLMIAPTIVALIRDAVNELDTFDSNDDFLP